MTNTPAKTAAKTRTYRWHLRQLMATRGLFQTTELVPLLAQRGIRLSREQVFRLVTQDPQRLSMDTLVALCDILDCGVADLIEITPVERSGRKTAAGADPTPRPTPPVRRTTIRRPSGS
jgi:DNA-binding Xre family transcriptional regulator